MAQCVETANRVTAETDAHADLIGKLFNECDTGCVYCTYKLYFNSESNFGFSSCLYAGVSKKELDTLLGYC